MRKRVSQPAVNTAKVLRRSLQKRERKDTRRVITPSSHPRRERVAGLTHRAQKKNRPVRDSGASLPSKQITLSETAGDLSHLTRSFFKAVTEQRRRAAHASRRGAARRSPIFRGFSRLNAWCARAGARRIQNGARLACPVVPAHRQHTRALAPR